MSSEEEDPTSPVLPKDSDRGSSVSSDLQDEYEELLRHAVVTPKLETLAGGQSKGLKSQSKCDSKSQHQRAAAKDGWLSSRSERSSQASPVIAKSFTPLKTSHADRTAGQSSSRRPALSENVPSERSGSISPEALHEFAATEIFISEENINKMESILDTWSSNLKSNVLTELRKWKLTFMEQHKVEMKKEKERHATQTAGLKAELESLKELLHTYETSNQRKDQVITNLSQVLDRQKEKLEKMRSFMHWRLQHAEAKEEAHAAQVAQQHYNMQLKKKVWFGWHGLIQKHWKVMVERACRSRAEEVCTRLSTDYEARLAEHCEALEKAQTEIRRLQVERERSEESMKKAFMRGVCALNMETLSMFQSAEGRPEQLPLHEQHDAEDEPRSASLAHLQPYPSTSTRFSPIHFDQPEPSYREHEYIVGSRAPTSQEEVLPPTTVVHSSLPLGGIAGSHKQVSSRVVTAGQQKPSKTVTARITARADLGKSARSNLQVMGVAPPISSVVVERHHPVTQLTVGQATAAKFPRSSKQSHTSAAARGSSRTHTNTCHVHSIKVVD
nr:centrosomal protein POC5 [Nothobranchius furzeri]XP_054587429.1 centrosomal protein POC5 [Nothobranchius furzeri]